MCPALQGQHRRPRRFGHRCRGHSIPAGSGSCGTVRFLRFAVQKACCEAVVQSGRPTSLISVKSGLKLGPTPPCLPRLGAGPNFVFTQRSPAEFGSELGGVPIASVASLRVLCIDGFCFLKSVVKAVLEMCRNLGGDLLLPWKGAWGAPGLELAWCSRQRSFLRGLKGTKVLFFFFSLFVFNWQLLSFFFFFF